jgi:peroxiredoxin
MKICLFCGPKARWARKLTGFPGAFNEIERYIMKKSFFPLAGTALALILLIGTLLFFVRPFKTPADGQAETGGTLSPGTLQAFAKAGIPPLRKALIPTDFSAPLVEGKAIKLSDLRGKVVFLNFWATWCGPCREEMPSMEALQRRFKDQGLEILGVNCQESPREVSSFMADQNLSFETALDQSGEIGGTYGVSAIPTTFIIDRKGRIIFRVVGSLNWADPRILSAFDALLRESS